MKWKATLSAGGIATTLGVLKALSKTASADTKMALRFSPTGLELMLSKRHDLEMQVAGALHRRTFDAYTYVGRTAPDESVSFEVSLSAFVDAMQSATQALSAELKLSKATNFPGGVISVTATTREFITVRQNVPLGSLLIDDDDFQLYKEAYVSPPTIASLFPPPLKVKTVLERLRKLVDVDVFKITVHASGALVFSVHSEVVNTRTVFPGYALEGQHFARSKDSVGASFKQFLPVLGFAGCQTSRIILSLHGESLCVLVMLRDDGGTISYYVGTQSADDA